MDLGFLQFASWSKEDGFSGRGFWIRFFGRGFSVTNAQPLFSERYGFYKTIKLPFGYRMKYLRKD